MVKFCPVCGYKLVQEFKFCPECGFELEKVRQVTNTEDRVTLNEPKENIFVDKIICNNCGEENDLENINCYECGAKLTDSITREIEQKPVNQHEKITSNVKSGPVVKSAKTKKNKIESKSFHAIKVKSLNKAKTIAIISIGTGLAILMLIFSGLLNTLIVPGNTSSVNTSQNSGIDVKNLKKINDLEAVVKTNPLDTASILELANLKNDAGMFEQAIVNYKQYLSLVPNDPAARIDMGICYYNLQNFDTAINEMEQALKYDPKLQIGYLNLGIVNLAAGKMEKSQEWLKKAVNIDPNSENGKKAQELLSSHNNQINGGK
jgi:tetratricopeptide (TPR) repeat protein